MPNIMTMLIDMKVFRWVLAAAFCVSVLPAPCGVAFAAEHRTKELEDVSDAEKVKWARATKVLITDAIRTAVDRTTGQVIEAALHSINGRLLYEIEVVTKDGTVVEIFIDPQTGKIVEMGEGR
jgi:uncharacterized membrane protein YkoI